MSPEAAFQPSPFQRLTGSATVAAHSEAADGYASGYAAGYAAGSRAAARAAAVEQRRLAEEEAARAAARAAEAEAALGVLATAVTAVRTAAQPVLAQAQDVLARAAVELAETILGLELAHGDTAVRAAMARVLSQPDATDAVRIRLNPQDAALLEGGLHGIRLPSGVELVADPQLPRGDAVAELTNGLIDARLTTALQRVRRVLEVTE